MTSPPGHDHDTIELPAATAWPMVVALGITLACAGLITHAAVSLVGIALALIGGVGWFREVLPEERAEPIVLRAIELRARAIVPSGAPVERFSLGEGGHRMRVPVEIQPYSAGITGGIVGGIAMAVLALVYGWTVQRSPWYPINLLSAVVLPGLEHATVEQLRTFILPAIVIGTIVHGAISMLVGLLYAVILPLLPRRHLLWGGIIAPLLWTSLVWALLGIVNPTLGARVDWPWFVATQIAFGLAAGFVVARATPLATMQTWPLAARAGVEASGVRAERERDR
jgi:hypothetical protein